MNIHIVSDVHEDLWLKFQNTSAIDQIPAGLGEVLVVAGDLREVESCSQELLCDEFKRLRQKSENVLYVNGNHEFYRLAVNDARSRLGEAASKAGVEYLDDRIVEISDRRFLGCTLWYNPRSPAIVSLGRSWSDYSILDFDYRIPETHDRNLRFLMSNVRKGDVVLTHMLPSNRSVAPQYKGTKENAFFVHDLETLMKFAQPKLWVHGHSHVQMDYKLNHTRVFSGPLGTPWEMPKETWDMGAYMKERLSRVAKI